MTGTYHSPRGLLPYQSADIDAAGALGRAVIGWDTGMGKTHALLGLACRLFGDDRLDTVLLVCESNKIEEWREDVERFTDLTARVHHGPGRVQALHGPLPQILITTYETARADAMELDFEQTFDGPLTAALAGRRVLVAYDEMPKLAVAASGLHQAHRHLIERLGPAARVVGLTATPLTRDWDSVYNTFRLICPQVLPTRDRFEQLCVRRREAYRTVWDPEGVRQHLLDPIAPYLLRRRKSDPEVAPMFPVMHEHVVHTAMTGEQADIYAAVESLSRDADADIPGLWGALRMLAAYPAALTATGHTERGGTKYSPLAADIVQAFGADTLRRIRPGKLDALLGLLEPVAADEEKAVVFSFFGPTVLPLLAADLARIGMQQVFVHHGGMTARARAQALDGFRGCAGPAVLLSSDAGSRGINLPQARHVIEYETSLTYMVGAQRRNRVHRLDSPHPDVHCTTLIADGTVEAPIASVMLRRNEQTDLLLGDAEADDGFVSAAARRAMMNLWSAQVPA